MLLIERFDPLRERLRAFAKIAVKTTNDYVANGVRPTLGYRLDVVQRANSTPFGDSEPRLATSAKPTRSINVRATLLR